MTAQAITYSTLALILVLSGMSLMLAGIADAIDRNTERCAPTAQGR